MSDEKIIMNFVLDIYSLMILLAVYVSAARNSDDKSKSRKMFDVMLGVVLFLVIGDAMSNLDGTEKSYFPILNHIGNFLIYLLGPAVAGLWVLYVANELMLDARHMRILKKIVTVLFFINLAVLIGTQFWGWYYYIDAENHYRRGPIFPLFNVINFIMILYSVYLLVRHRRTLPKHRTIALILFALLPIIGIAIQLIFYGFSVTVNILVFGLLVAYIFIQKENLDTDFLTGIGNRRKLDVSLKSYVHANRPFSAILLDLDNFKQINDRFGHEAGDSALKKTVEILRASVREGDIITRYGGDEFCILAGIDNQESLKECVKRIRKNFETYNEDPDTLIPLELSIGYLVYEPGRGTISEFLKKLDQRMYKDKFQRKKFDL